MKNFLNLLLYGILFFGIAANFSSCTIDKDEDETPELPDLTGNSIFVPNESEVTISVSVVMEDDWQISNKSDWFKVNPLVGKAGEVTLNITVLDTNPELTEKVSSFMVKSGGLNTQYFVIQDVTPGFNLAGNRASMDEKEQTYSFKVEGNVKYEAVSDADWLTVKEIKYDSTLLADNTNYSKYMTSSIELSVSANSSAVRQGKITLKGADGKTNESITVEQWGDDMKADFNKKFYRYTFMMKHTADWCGPCGMSSEYIHNAIEQRPGRLLYTSFYINCDVESLSAWQGAVPYFLATGSEGIPTCVMNNYCIMIGAYPEDILVELIDESTEKFVPENALGGYATIKDGNVELDLRIAAKRSGNYKVSVFLLEDGLQYYQAAIGDNYIHNNVARCEMTEMWGQSVNLTGGSVEKMSFSCEIPSYVENQDNLHIYAVVYKKGDFKGSVSDITYMTLENMVVDNAVDIPLNEVVSFKYEE